MRQFVLLVLGFSLSVSQISLAQSEDHPHHEKHYADVSPIETDEIKMEVIRPHSQENFTQFTVKIYNKTDDYILINRHEIVFESLENGYGKNSPKEAVIFIEPHGNITRSIKVEGGVGFKVDEIEVTLGGFSRAPIIGKPTKGGDFKMKPDKNSIMLEPFAVTLKKWRYNSKELSADFKIRYRGESIGFLNESKVTIRKEDGTILQNEEAKDRTFTIAPMKTRTVTVVKGFKKGELAKNESVYVVWGDAMSEAENKPFQVPGFSLMYDAENTLRENK